MRAWARRTAELHDELAAIADDDPRWWLLAGGAAVAEGRRGGREYIISDAEPASDTFIGYRAGAPIDPVGDAIARARAARTALRELDGQLPDQPVAVTVRRTDTGAAAAVTERNSLETAAFVVGDRCLVGALDDPSLGNQIAQLVGGFSPTGARRGAAPFVCVSVGEDPIGVARHGHRRAWTAHGGPWLGLGRTGELATVSTTHMVVDGYGHARVAGRIAQLAGATSGPTGAVGRPPVIGATALAIVPETVMLPALAPVVGALPLGVAWRELRSPAPRVLPLAYALGRILHRLAGKRDARFSPTFQVPVAPGRRDDPERRKRRIVPAAVSVRFADGKPEPYAVFEARTREALLREASGRGLIARLMAAASAAPAPLAWKRKSISPVRPRWLEKLALVLGGRACLSRIGVDAPVPAACAVSSPPLLATANDPFGSCVVTIIDDGERSAITACGSGLAGNDHAASAFLDELLQLTAS